jgi:hypothetical protein
MLSLHVALAVSCGAAYFGRILAGIARGPPAIAQAPRMVTRGFALSLNRAASLANGVSLRKKKLD